MEESNERRMSLPNRQDGVEDSIITSTILSPLFPSSFFSSLLVLAQIDLYATLATVLNQRVIIKSCLLEGVGVEGLVSLSTLQTTVSSIRETAKPGEDLLDTSQDWEETLRGENEKVFS